jgi:hypothetical protein
MPSDPSVGGGSPAAPQPIWPKKLPQWTATEVDRTARGLARGPSGAGWVELPDEFALMHYEARATHNLRLEGSLIARWWGRPNTMADLLAELAKFGHDAIIVEHIVLGMLVLGEKSHVDVEIDKIIARMGPDRQPRSRQARATMQVNVWRILTLLSALKVIGARAYKVYDRVAGKMVVHDIDDPLITVNPFKPRGTQEAFDSGSAPLIVSLGATPWLERWRGDRRVLQYFGNVLAIIEIPIGKPSGAWARAIMLAL